HPPLDRAPRERTTPAPPPGAARLEDPLLYGVITPPPGGEGGGGARGGLVGTLQFAQGKGRALPTAFLSPMPERNAARAADGDGMRLDVDDAGGVFIDTEDHDIISKHRFEQTQPRLAHPAEARVVRPAFAVVVVRDDGTAHANRTQHVETLRPRWVVAHLVDLVHRQRIRPESDGGRAREGKATASRDFFDEQIAHPMVAPVPNGVGGTAGAGEHVIGVANTPQELLDFERGRPTAVTKGCRRDLASDV